MQRVGFARRQYYGQFFHDHVRDACRKAGIEALLVRNAGGWSENFGTMIDVGVYEGNSIYYKAKIYYPDANISEVFPFIDFDDSVFSHPAHSLSDEIKRENDFGNTYLR